MSNNNSSAGKGDKPRSCFSKEFKDNYDLIDWSRKKEKEDKDKKDVAITKNKQ